MSRKENYFFFPPCGGLFRYFFLHFRLLAQAVTSALSDRLKILRIRAGTNFADGNLSPLPLRDYSIADDTKVSGFSIAQTIKRIHDIHVNLISASDTLSIAQREKPDGEIL